MALEVWRKVARSHRAFVQERDALLLWSPHVNPCGPTLVDSVWHGTQGVLTMTRVDGIDALAWWRGLESEAHGGVVEDGAWLSLLHQVGQWLRGLHALPPRPGADALALDEGLRARARAGLRATPSAGAMARALTRLTAPGERVAPAGAVAERFAALIAHLQGDVPGAPMCRGRVPCHRDLQPRNWLVDPRGHLLAVLDFEHAREDDPLVDVLRLTDEGPAIPHGRALGALISGYGDPAGWEGAAARLRWLRALHALNTGLWALRHRDASFAALALTQAEAWAAG